MALRKRRPPGIQAHTDARPRQGKAVPAARFPMVPDLDREKRELRARCTNLRADAARQRPDAASIAGRRLVEELLPSAGDVVAGYQAFRSELDPLPAMVELHKRGVKLCLPVVVAKHQPLAFRSWEPGTAMKRGVFGVDVPVDGRDCTPALAIVPLLAWDRAGGRLGYGGGFYDRTLHALRGTGQLRRAIGLAYAAQEVPEVPRGAMDALLDGLVTELETLVWSAPCGS